MKRRIFSIMAVLVLVISFSLVTAVLVGAADGDPTTTLSIPENVYRPAPFDATSTTTNGATVYDNVRFNITVSGSGDFEGERSGIFTITAVDPGGVQGINETFVLVDGDFVGYWGLPGGFELPGQYNEISTFTILMADTAPVGTYDITVELVEDPLGTANVLATATDGFTLSDDTLYVGTGDEQFTAIQDAINAATAGDIINVAAGIYAEDLTITGDTTGLELAGADGATIQGQAAGTGPNLLSYINGLEIHGFNIEIPSTPGLQNGGWIITGTDIQIYDNHFLVTGTGDYALVIHTIAGSGDISGMNIHDNSFDSENMDDNAELGYAGVYLNYTSTNTGTVTVKDNTFDGDLYQAVFVERSNTIVEGNTVVTLQDGDVGIVIMGQLYGEVRYPIDNVDILDNSISGFTSSIKVGKDAAPAQVLTDVVLTGNDLDGLLLVRSSAAAITVVGNNLNTVENIDPAAAELDATLNWWGSASGPTHESNTYTVPAGTLQGNAVSDLVDFVPWLDEPYDTGVSFAPVENADTSEQFSSIQAAIYAALPDTTVNVAAGEYTENLIIDKSLTVQGAGADVTDILVDAEFGIIVYLGYDEDNEDAPLPETVVFDGFYIYEAEVLIYLADVNNGSSLTISNNVLDDFFIAGIMSDGFTVDNGSTVTIEGNYILGFGGDYGIEFTAVADSTVNITGNEIVWNSQGIYIDNLVEVSTVTIESNLVAANYYGIDFYEVADSTVTITGNTIGEGYSEEWDDPLDGNAGGGIYFSGEDTVSGSAITIQGNVIVGNGWDDGFGGIYVENLQDSSLEILNNGILDNYDDGVYIGYFDVYTTVDIHYNDILDNYDYGVYNNSAYAIDATNNWWGDATGADPDIEANNPHLAAAAGDAVSDYVVFMPWYATETTTSGSQYVSVDHTPISIIAYSDTIQGGIDAALAGDTVIVAAGTYAENVVLPNGKSITLLGAQANIDPTDGRAGPESILDGWVGGLHGTGNGITLSPAVGTIKINGFTIQGYEYGIKGTDSGGVVGATISYNIFDGNGNDGNAPNYFDIANNEGGGIRVYNMDDSTISYNVVKNGERGIRLDNASNSGSDGNLVSHNLIHDNEQYGIAIYAGGDNNLIEYNIIYNSADRGIQLGWGGDHAGNVIQYNEIYDVNNEGILITNATDFTITGNTIYNVAFTDQTLGRPTGGAPDSSGFSQQGVHGGIVLYGTNSNVTITGNVLHDNGEMGIGNPWGDIANAVTSWATSDGIWISSDSTAIVNNNSIYDNNEYGLENMNTDTAVDAKFNWWGSASGPTHPSNGLGTGDAVSDYVDYIPWLDAEDGDEVYLVYIGITGYVSIQTAIDAANPGDTITVAPGTYVVDTTITISKDLTLSAPDGAKLTGTGSNPVVTIEDYNVTLDGFEIDPGTDGVNIPLISIDNVVTIENSVIFDNTEQGIDVGTVLGTLNILNNIIYDNGNEGIYIDLVDDGGTLNILNNIIAQNTQEGIRIAKVDDGGIVVIQGNEVGAWEDADYTFTGNGNEGIEIFQVLNGSTVTIGGAIEDDANLIAANVQQGIYVEELYYGSTLTIEGNIIGAWEDADYTFAGNGGSGFYIYYVDYGSTLTIIHSGVSIKPTGRRCGNY